MSELTIVIAEKYKGGFHPLYYSSLFDIWGMACLYQGVCMYNNKYNLDNRLSKQIVETNEYIEVELNDYYWHDAKPITAYDFKYSFEHFYCPERMPNNKILNSIFGSHDFYSHRSKTLKGIQIINDKSFRIYSNLPFIYTKSLLTIPIFQNNSIKPHNFVCSNLIGNGSYKLVSSNNTDEAHFIKNEHYFLGNPKIDKVHLLGCDTYQLIDLISNILPDLTIVDAAQIKRIPKSILEKYRIFSLPQLVSTVLHINPNSTLFYSLNARKMISHSINRNLLVHALFSDYAYPQDQFIPRIIADHFDTDIIYYDKSHLNSSIDQLTIGYSRGNNEHRMVAEFLKNNLKDKANIHIYPFESKTEAFNNKADLYISQMFHTMTPVSNQFIYNNANIFKQCSDYLKLIDLDTLLFGQNWSLYYREYMTETANVLPVIPLYSKHEIQLVSKNIKNIKPDSRGAFWNIHEIDK